METERQHKLARLVHKELAQILQQEQSLLPAGGMLTLTKTTATADFGIARIYVSFMAVPNAAEALKNIQSKTRELRYKLGKCIRHQVRKIPELVFFLDDTNDYVARMDALFAEVMPAGNTDLASKPIDAGAEKATNSPQ